jgi:HD-GYP domain-containing protein (c-di-GMP phosphodiesterase class II)
MPPNIRVKLKNVLLSLSEATEVASHLIARHQQRTCYIAMEIARFGKADRQLTQAIFIAALLHDIGAISVEEKIALRAFKTHNKFLPSDRPGPQ